MNNTELTKELVRELFSYKDGILYHNISGRRKRVGAIAGNMDDGRVRVFINGKQYYRSRIVFLYHSGFIPKYLDHIDGDTLNDRMSNLRQCTISQNGMNRGSGKNSSSQYKGVHWDKSRDKWCSQILVNGNKKHLGRFAKEKDAAMAYDKAANELHGIFARLNFN